MNCDQLHLEVCSSVRATEHQDAEAHAASAIRSVPTWERFVAERHLVKGANYD
jgi:hypothetical protein